MNERKQKITPAKAQKWLDDSTTLNRTVRKNWVGELAGAMKRDEWVYNGDAIRFDAKGNLLDGQHRLLAVIASGATIESDVIEGLDPSAMATIDRGRVRSMGDNLKLLGYVNPHELGAVARAIWHWRRGNPPISQGTGVAPTVTEIVAIVEKEHDDLMESVHLGARLNRAHPELGLSQTMIGTLHYIFWQETERVDADEFMEDLFSERERDDGDPVDVLRRKLFKNAFTRDKVSKRVVIAWAIKVFNAFMAGEDMQALYWRPGGPSSERFPRVKPV